MKKALTFLSAFVVSFVIIYSIYYYTRPAQLRYLEKGFTAVADTLEHTLVMPHPYEPSSTKNTIYNAGILRALQQAEIPLSAANINEDSNIINTDFHVTYEGVYNEVALTEMNTALKKKFSNHPPLELKNIGRGQDMLFSYLFRNAFFPQGFAESAEGIKFKGKNVKAIVYDASKNEEKDQKKIQLFISPDKKSYAIKIAIDAQEEAVWAYTENTQHVTSGFKAAQAIMAAEAPYKPAAGEQIIMPVIDFYLVKNYKNQELENFFSMQKKDFALIQERIKIKTSAEAVTNMLGKKRNENKPLVSFSENSIFYLKRTDAAFPYFGIVLNNPQILIPQP